MLYVEVLRGGVYLAGARIRLEKTYCGGLAFGSKRMRDKLCSSNRETRAMMFCLGVADPLQVVSPLPRDSTTYCQTRHLCSGISICQLYRDILPRFLEWRLRSRVVCLSTDDQHQVHC